MNSINNQSKNDLLTTSLLNFFTNDDNINIFTPVIHGDSKISLRVIDWFVTNYSKKNNISYFITDDNQIEIDSDNLSGKKYKQFVVYLDYKLQLKGYQKKQFDPFCRRSRIDFFYKTDKYIVTTVGQLNFFKWAISNKILDYIDKHLKTIELDMNSCYKAVYNISKIKNIKLINNDISVTNDDIDESEDNEKISRRKRQQLSVSATKTLSKTNVKVIVSFD
jgi:hypothetical protein